MAERAIGRGERTIIGGERAIGRGKHVNGHEQANSRGRGSLLEALKYINSNEPSTSSGSTSVVHIGRGSINPLLAASTSAPAPGCSTTRGIGRGAVFDISSLRIKCESKKSDEFEEESKLEKPIRDRSYITNVAQLREPKRHAIVDAKSNEQEDKKPVTMLGKSGHAVDLSANYLRLSVTGNHGAFEYRVNFIPEIEYKAFRLKMLREHSDELGTDLTFDGQTLFLPDKLNDDVTEFKSKHPIDNTYVTIKVIFIKKRELENMVHLFNVLFKRIMAALNLVKIGRECYDLEKTHSIPQYKLKLLPGYVTAVSVYEDGLMLNMDPLHKVVRTQTVLNEIYEISETFRGKDINNAIKGNLSGKSIITQYNGKLYTISDVDFSKNPLTEFTLSSGKSISFLNYYKSQYGKDITDLKQPLLIHRHLTRKSNPTPTDKHDEQLICLVPELCNMTGLTDDMRNNHSMMKELSRYMKISPNQRYQFLKEYVKNVTSNEKAMKMLDNWGLRIDPLPVTLSARELNPENIKFGENKVVSATTDADWNKGSMVNPVFTPIDINNWIILYTQKDFKYTKDFCECVIRCGKATGIKVSQPKLILLKSDRLEYYVEALRNEINPYLQLVVCICPNNRDDRYAAIKKTCCVDNPIPSQVINGFTLSKPMKLRSVAHKILLQLNCKLGGTLWSVDIPYQKLMVIGLDVYHSKSLNSQSVCGFVASYNLSLTKWYSRVCFQRPGQEIIDQLKICFIDSLKLFFNTNGVFPDRIIVYRDGVGDGQFVVCKDYEVPQIQSCFEQISSDYSPMFTYVIVQKRNNTRIFTTPSRNTMSSNPNPGTIVDNTVTRRFLYDFYVVSHKAREGSLVPTHYIVIHDSSSMEPDHVQRMTFKMCHLYFNWPGTVRVPAPCQYAHKLAYLIGSSVKKEHDLSLADRLFFL